MSDSTPNQTMNTPIPAATLALRAIRVEGRDAFAFLQAQLTADLTELESGLLMSAAWCDANGRVSVFCPVSWDDQGAWLIAPADRIADTLRRIRMYGIGREVSAKDAGPVRPAELDAPNAMRFKDPEPRALAIVESPPDDDATPALPDGWLLDDLHRRIPWITTATAGLFLPQMIGVDALGGLSYRKGCYPGQEVIARVHYRGRVTRQPALMRVQTDVRPLPGATLTPERGDPRVLYAAPDPDGGHLLLAVVPVGAEDEPQTRYRLGDSECVALDKPR